MEKREEWIDNTKLFACILVVIGHLLQGLNKADIQWNNNLYEYINNFIYIFHMPLFMCLSGYLYAKLTKISNIKEYGLFIKKKFINLSIPYVVFYVEYVIINMIFANSVNSQKGIQDILNILTNPMPPFWFLYALFLIFVIVPIVEKIYQRKTYLVFAVFVLLHLLEIFVKTPIYAINIVCQYGVYFYLGKVVLENVKRIDTGIKMSISNIVIFNILGFTYSYIVKEQIFNIRGLLPIIQFLLAIYGTIVSIQFFRLIENKLVYCKIINFMSKYTFSIYLMHTMFSAGIRIVLLKLGIYNFYIHFILGLIMGMVMPILVTIILEKTKYGEIILYPLKTIKKIKEDNNENCYDRT